MTHFLAGAWRQRALTRAAVAALVAAGITVRPVRADPPSGYLVHAAGLTDIQYTRADGGHTTDPYAINPTGQAIGTSNRYVGFEFHGRAAWFYDPVTEQSTPIGLRGDGFVNLSNYIDISPSYLNAAGQVVGQSGAWNGDNWLGSWTWLYDHTRQTTLRIGLTDPPHTAGNGEQRSNAVSLGADGTVVGYSNRYNGTADAGLTAWLYRDPSTGAMPIGPSGAQYVRSDGYSSSTPSFLDPSGLILGSSSRYDAMASTGIAPWFYDPATGATTLLGFRGGAYTRAVDGYEESSTLKMRASRYVAGSSSMFVGSSTLYDAWVYDRNTATYQHFGLTDAEHTGAGGARSSGIVTMDDRGDVAGVSNRYSPSGATLGNTAWQYNAATGQTHATGLTSAENTSPSGVRSSSIFAISPLGHVVGTSKRYDSNGIERGASAWIFDPADNTTTRLGLFDAHYTHPFGDKVSGISKINAVGQVLGYSQRYDFIPSASWFYDPATKVQTTLIFSTWSDGYWQTNPGYLGDDGVVLGSYLKSDGTTNHSNANISRAFYWSMADGFRDLGSLVSGGLDEHQWQFLHNAITRSGRHFLGTGFEAGSGGTLAFLFSPISGDSNHDGKVDFADLVTLAQNYNTAGGRTFEQGDFNADGNVDFADLVRLAQHYNNAPGSGGVPQLGTSFDADFTRALAQVPEPAFSCALAGSIPLLLRRSRPRSRPAQPPAHLN